MKNKILQIDFEIIWKSIHASLNEDEQILLDRWLAEDDKHRIYYEQVVNHYKQKEPDMARPDIASLWNEIETEEYGRPEGSGKRKWLPLIAASVAILIVALVIFLRPPASDLTDTSVAQHSDTQLSPGNKAILRLGNGKTIVLGAEKSTSTRENGSTIDITGESVRYSDEEAASTGPVAMHEIEVPTGGEFTLILSDGTKVWLNSQSTLKYPAVFSKDKRIVQLTGEAYFEVTHRSTQPFEVVAADQTITVLGTSFNVSHYPEDQEIVSTLVEGKVRIDTRAGSKTTLSPGEQSVYNKESNEITRQKVNVEKYIAWKNGLFYFENESLERIMKILSRWYGVKVVYTNPAQKQERFTGTLKRYNTFENVIDLIEMTQDVKFEIKENVVIIE